MLKRLLLVLVVALVAIQFVRPHKNLSPAAPGRDDFVVRFAPPPEIRATLQTACYDCHSNNTRYPWYAEVQPVGWWLGQHIRDGKEALNLSDFGTYTAKRQARKINAMGDELTDHAMPLPSYTWIHRDARLTEAQIATLTTWLDDLHEKVAPPAE